MCCSLPPNYSNIPLVISSNIDPKGRNLFGIILSSESILSSKHSCVYWFVHDLQVGGSECVWGGSNVDSVDS